MKRSTSLADLLTNPYSNQPQKRRTSPLFDYLTRPKLEPTPVRHIPLRTNSRAGLLPLLQLRSDTDIAKLAALKVINSPLYLQEEKTILSSSIIRKSEERISETASKSYETSEARTIPSPSGVGYDKAKLMKNSWVLDVDLRGSTELLKSHPKFYPRIMQSFVNEVTEIARDHGAEVGNFHGDGITAIFKGGQTRRTSNRVVEAGIVMNTMVNKVLSPTYFLHILRPIKCGIGISYGDFWTIRAGAKFTDDSTLVWAGEPVNQASKFAEEAPGGQITLSYKTYQLLTPTRSVAKYKWQSFLNRKWLETVYCSKLEYPYNKTSG